MTPCTKALCETPKNVEVFCSLRLPSWKELDCSLLHYDSCLNNTSSLFATLAGADCRTATPMTRVSHDARGPFSFTRPSSLFLNDLSHSSWRAILTQAHSETTGRGQGSVIIPRVHVAHPSPTPTSSSRLQFNVTIQSNPHPLPCCSDDASSTLLCSLRLCSCLSRFPLSRRSTLGPPRPPIYSQP